LAAIAMFYFFTDEVPALLTGLALLGFSANSFYQAHKCYQQQYQPKKNEAEDN
jgi:predicted benzoate:H+ symporter BenE